MILCVCKPCYSRNKLVSSPLAEKEEGPPKLIFSLTLLDGRSAQAGEADLSCTGQDLNSSQGLECESPPLHLMWGPHSLSSSSSALYIIIMAIIIMAICNHYQGHHHHRLHQPSMWGPHSALSCSFGKPRRAQHTCTSPHPPLNQYLLSSTNPEAQPWPPHAS